MDKPNVLCIASCIQDNNKEEAEAVTHYTDLLNMVDESDLDESDKNHIKEEINEIIRDELDHQSRLNALYQGLTGLVPKE